MQKGSTPITYEFEIVIKIETHNLINVLFAHFT